MQDHDPSYSGESQDRSLERFFQILARTEKYIYFTTKWKLLDNSIPDDILDEVAMRVEDNDEYRLAHNIFCGLPKKSRLAYALHYGGGLSVTEIARLRNTTEDKIESSLKKIKHILQNDATHAMITRFVEIELQFAEEKCREMSVALMQKHGIDPTAVYGATQAIDPSVMLAVMDIASHGINQIAQNLGHETPEDLETATADDAVNSDKFFDEVFDEILEALKPVHDESLVKKVEELVRLMKQTANTASFSTHYKSFTRIAANHCSRLTTFLARLAEFLPDFKSSHS